MNTHSCWCLGLLLVSFQPGFSQTAPREETVMRQTYAKLSYVVQTTAVLDAIQDDSGIDAATLDRKVNEQQLEFAIKDVTTGDLRDIAAKSGDDYVTKPEAGDGLTLGSGHAAFGDGRKAVVEVEIHPKWQKPAPATRGPLTWGDLTIGRALAMGDGKAYDRYAAASVTVSLGARAHTYRTFWLFDSKGKQPVLPVDLIVGNSELAELVTADVSPNALLDTVRFSSHPAVRRWLLTHQLPDDACTGTVCCLPSGQCGVTASSVANTLQKYAEQPANAAISSTTTRPSAVCCNPPPPPLACSSFNYSRTATTGDEDTTQHLNGYHGASVVFNSACDYTNATNGSAA